MFIKECTISLVLPFAYDENCYAQTDPEINLHLRENFNKKAIRPNWLNPIGETRFTNQESGLMMCLELKNERRRMIGLAQNNIPIYRITKTDLDIWFGIDHIRVWFWKMGKGFITIQVSAQDLTAEEMLDFKRILTDVKRKQKIRYTEAIGRDEEIIRDITLKKLIEGSGDGQKGLLTLIGSVRPQVIRGNAFGTFEKAYNITYIVADSISADSLLVFLENLRIDTGSGYQGEKEISDDMHYVKEGHKVHWTVSDRSLIMLGDCGNRYVCGRGGLHHSVFRGYMLLYQYYLCLYEEYFEARAYIDSLKIGGGECDKNRIERWMRYEHIPDKLTNQEHINCIFLEYLCGNVWNLQESVQDIYREYSSYYNHRYQNIPAAGDSRVFISFKNLDANGQPTEDSQLAEDLYKSLEARDIHPFFSNHSLLESGEGCWRRGIDSALKDAEILILVGTSLENIQADQVAYEWEWSFLEEIINRVKPKAQIFTYIKGMDLKSLPAKLRNDRTVFQYERHSLEYICDYIENALKRL